MIPGVKSTVDPYIIPAQVRCDFLRTGVLGGVGEGIWAVGECEMLVNGAVVAVTFSFGPPATEDWVLKNILMGYVCPAAATAVEWGTTAAALANGIEFQLANNTPATLGLAAINVNGDFMKIGTPAWTNVGAADVAILSTWTPDMPIMLRSAVGERVNIIINDNLTGGGAMGTTLWAIARAYRHTDV